MKKSEALNTLGLAQGASEEDIKKAHRKLTSSGRMNRRELRLKKKRNSLTRRAMCF